MKTAITVMLAVVLLGGCLKQRPNVAYHIKEAQPNFEKSGEILVQELEDEIAYREMAEKSISPLLEKSTTVRFSHYDTTIVMLDSGFQVKVTRRQLAKNHKFDDIPLDTLKEWLRPKVVYGNDDRREYYELSSEERGVVNSVVCFIKRNKFRKEGDYYILNARPFERQYQTCTTERFKEQPLAAFCSGFAVGSRVVATAGHCIDGKGLEDYYIVFGFNASAPGRIRQIFHADNVYEASSTIKYELDPYSKLDYGLIEVNKPIPQANIASIRTAAIEHEEDIYVAGHPVGLPLKIAGGARARDVSGTNYFTADLDTYGGNSGSPVFDRQHQVVGILVRGARDFNYSYEGNCRYTNSCPRITDGAKCGGEEVTRNLQYISELNDYLNTQMQ